MTRDRVVPFEARPVHAVHAWSGKREDEAPLCGIDCYAPGGMGAERTIFPEHVTCPECVKKLTPASKFTCAADLDGEC